MQRKEMWSWQGEMMILKMVLLCNIFSFYKLCLESFEMEACVGFTKAWIVSNVTFIVRISHSHAFSLSFSFYFSPFLTPLFICFKWNALRLDLLCCPAAERGAGQRKACRLNLANHRILLACPAVQWRVREEECVLAFIFQEWCFMGPLTSQLRGKRTHSVANEYCIFSKLRQPLSWKAKNINVKIILWRMRLHLGRRLAVKIIFGLNYPQTPPKLSIVCIKMNCTVHKDICL